jgi:hypothetical protein
MFFAADTYLTILTVGTHRYPPAQYFFLLK